MSASRNDLSKARRLARLAGAQPPSEVAHGRRADKLAKMGVLPEWLIPVADSLKRWCQLDYLDSEHFDVSHDLALEAASAGVEEVMAALHRPRAKALHFKSPQQFDSWAKKTGRHAARKHILAAVERQTHLVIDATTTDGDDGEHVEAMDRLSYTVFELEKEEVERCPKNVRYAGPEPLCEDVALHPPADRHIRRSSLIDHDVDHVAPIVDDFDAPDWASLIA